VTDSEKVLRHFLNPCVLGPPQPVDFRQT
jgi:hypothetical protein